MELTIENLIKILIGVLVIAAVSYGAYYFFSNNFFDFFRNMGSNSTSKLFISLLY